MKLVISKSVTTSINLIVTVEYKNKCGETKNPATGGLDVDERNKYNHFVNVNCIQTSCSTFHVIDHVIEFSDRFTV